MGVWDRQSDGRTEGQIAASLNALLSQGGVIIRGTCMTSSICEDPCQFLVYIFYHKHTTCPDFTEINSEQIEFEAKQIII